MNSPVIGGEQVNRERQRRGSGKSSGEMGEIIQSPLSLHGLLSCLALNQITRRSFADSLNDRLYRPVCDRDADGRQIIIARNQWIRVGLDASESIAPRPDAHRHRDQS